VRGANDVFWSASSANDQPDRHGIACGEALRFADAGLNRHQIAAVFGKQGRRPRRSANLHLGGWFMGLLSDQMDVTWDA
jgi:hypothetical protein